MLSTEIDDQVAVVTLNRPARFNALSWELMNRLRTEIDLLGHRDDVTAIVITGAGRAFSAGADLHDFAASEDMPAEVAHHLTTTMAPLARAVLTAPVPVIAAVNGPCAGGALGLALLCDIVVAARSSYFLVPQVFPLGGVPDLGATWVLGRLVGRARALGMSLTGERVPAEQAEQWGMIWRCVDDHDLLDNALTVARRLAGSPAAVVATRALVDAGFSATLDIQLELEAQHQSARFADPAVATAVEQFSARTKARA
jgi:2-(1,2-epoxy-1,2-dihydrophenyl)acetyl-CoA isomerase